MRNRIALFLFMVMSFCLVCCLSGCGAIQKLSKAAPDEKAVAVAVACAAITQAQCFEEPVLQAALPGIAEENCKQSIFRADFKKININKLLEIKQSNCSESLVKAIKELKAFSQGV